MVSSLSTLPPAAAGAWRICAAGMVSLVVAMGIGRFAFTPVLPLMQAQGTLTLAQGAWLATANYLGYFAGAATAARLGADPRSLVRRCVLLVAVATAAMGLTSGMAPWVLLRFAAGLLSAWMLVGTSAWGLAALAERGRADLGGVLYAGVGAGIAAAGLLCLAGDRAGLPAQALWWSLGAFAAVLGVVALALVPPAQIQAAPAAAPSASSASASTTAGAGQARLVGAYGCFGFGYILPATFLPAMAREMLSDPALFGWSWPVFGLAAALSTIAAGSWFARVARVRLWVACQLAMALGTALPALWASAASVLLSALLVGGTFMVITMAGLQEARQRAGAHAAALLGRMTAAFALGQIAGPVASGLLGVLFPGQQIGMRVALLVATAVLVASALWLQQSDPHPQTSGAIR